MKKKNLNVIFLQETHGDNKNSQIWSNEFGSMGYFANGTSSSRGVATFFCGKFHKNIRDIVRDINGRYLIISMELNGLTYCFVNVYAPNENCPKFFEEIQSKIAELECMFMIVGGDFNVVRDAGKDRSTERIYNAHNQEAITKMMDSHNLLDIWRLQHPDDKKFTWCRRVGSSFRWSRIDYFLVSEELFGKIVCNGISPAILTDHSLIHMELDTGVPKRGRGVWKFNESLLDDQQFVSHMQQHLENTKVQYDHLDKIQLWELLKHEAIRISQEESKRRSIAKRDHSNLLYVILEEIQDKLIENSEDIQLQSSERSVKTELEVLATEDAKSSAFRCRKNWAIHGEKSSKFFFNLEKHNAINKTMYAIRKSDGTLTKDYTEILNEQQVFYSKLYGKDPSVSFTMQNKTAATFSPTSHVLLEQDFTIDELYDAMMTLKSGKTPGLDGLGVGFYRKFWNVLKQPLFDMYQVAVEQKHLNPSARKGLINLIPKKSDRDYELKSWRPLVLLNYDYKIFAKLLANRMDIVTKDIIGPQQYGFIKNRSAISSIRRTIEVVTFLKKTRTPGLIAIIDFEKAFDRISYSAIKGMLTYFGAGPVFTDYLFLLFNDFQACTQTNGYLSRLFTKGRGVNQGCPASPTAFIWTGELLAHLIQTNRNIQGISIHGLEALLAQFADDTSSFLKYDPLVIKEFCDTLRRVELNTGLKISYDKTAIYRVGSIRNSNAKFYTEQDLNWLNENIKTLGVTISCDGGTPKENFEEIVDKLNKVCNLWYNRTLSLAGRILVVNTLMASLFVYKMSVLLDLTKEQLRQVNGIIHNFLWKGKRARIAMNTLCKDRKDGGLKLVDISAKQTALKVGWIPRLDDDAFLANCAYHALCPVLRNNIWRCNLSVSDVKTVFEANYWSGVLEAWAKLKFAAPISKIDVMYQIVWYNSYIKISGRPVMWKDFHNAGILFVCDLFDEDGQPKTATDFELPVSRQWLKLQSLLHAIPKNWKTLLTNDNWGSSQKDPLDIIYSKNSCKLVYDILIEDQNVLRKYHKLWHLELPDMSYENYKNRFKHFRGICKIVKYWDFQYRLMLHKMVTNVDLFEWGKINSPFCPNCGKRETYQHVLYDCKYVKNLVRFVCAQVPITDLCTFEEWVFNELMENPFHIINYYAMVCKQYIYRCKCRKTKPNITQFEDEMIFIQRIELQEARRVNNIRKYNAKWGPVGKDINSNDGTIITTMYDKIS